MFQLTNHESSQVFWEISVTKQTCKQGFKRKFAQHKQGPLTHNNMKYKGASKRFQ